MGLIKAMGGSTRGVLADSWRDFFYCESLDASTLASKGQKKTGNPDRSSNAKGDENVISNGSIVAINDGQCMIIVESGAVANTYMKRQASRASSTARWAQTSRARSKRCNVV